MVKLYADVPARRARQLAGDIWLVVWTLCWIWIAVKLHGLIMSLAAPGQAIADGATGLAESIDSAGESVSGIPLIGDALSAPFSGMSDAAGVLASAGQAEADAVASLAMFVSVVLAVLAFASFAAFWIPLRVSFIRKASAAQRFVDANEDLDLFALRAPARRSLDVLACSRDDPAGAVVLVGTGGISWSDVDETTTPNLWVLLRDGASAALVARSVNSNTCPIDGWLGVSSGSRASAERTGDADYPANRPCPPPPTVTTQRHPELVSGSKVPPAPSLMLAEAAGPLAPVTARLGCVERWTLKQVQGDETSSG